MNAKTEEKLAGASHLAFEGIENFRDFGGYAAGSRRLKRNLLFRSAHHGAATEQDVEALKRLGLSLVIDLRRPEERRRSPTRHWDAFSAEIIENDVGERAIDHFVKRLVESDDAFREFMVEYYMLAPHEARHVDLFTRYFDAMARAPGPVLVHCAAGKDRTGILCALTHHLAGVHPDDIVEDYLKTNSATRLERAAAFAKLVQEHTGIAVSEEKARMAMRVEPEYLAAALKAMNTVDGSVDAYIAKALNVDAKKRDAILRHILE